MQKVLDIDMDFFLDNIAHWIDGDDRLDDLDYKPWIEDKFRAFLEERCLLNKDKKIKGRVVTNHDEAFFFWDELINSNKLRTPFKVTHIDAHSDTGMGDTGYIYISDQLMHYPISVRRSRLNIEKVYMGNYLSYAMACGWISEVDFVLHEKWKDDFVNIFLKDFDIEKSNFQFKAFPKGVDIGMSYGSIIDGRIQPINMDQEIPFSLIPWEEFKAIEEFDYMVFCKSPGYTPESADFMIEIIKEYIEVI